VDDPTVTDDTFERLMGKQPAQRFLFIQERALFSQDALDI
jgi:DNA gyrase/topoisomerase IV subunit B